MTKEEFIKKVRDAIIDGEMEQALDLLVSQREGFAKDSFTDIAMLSGRFKEARIALGNGTINFNDFSRISALVRQSVIDIIVRIENPEKGSLSKKKGELLYKIPSTMQVAKKHNCIVRVAYDRDLLTKKLTVDENTIIEDITLTKVMSAELIDTNPEKAFDVKTVYDNRQYLIKDGYTEWLFDVTPLKTGKHTLTLKVSAIEKVDGESQKRNIVFEKGISIESEIENPKEEEFVVIASPKKLSVKEASGSYHSAAQNFEDTDIIIAPRFSIKASKGNYSLMKRFLESYLSSDKLNFKDLEKSLKKFENIHSRQKSKVYSALEKCISYEAKLPNSKSVFYQTKKKRLANLDEYPWTKIEKWVGRESAERLYEHLLEAVGNNKE